MTLLSDLTSMYDAAAQQLSFDTARINSTGIHDFIASAFKTTQLMIGGVAQAPAQQGTTVSFEGTSISWQKGTQDLAFPSGTVARVRLDFYDADTKPTLLLAIVLQDSWKFSRTFPSLQQTFWDNVSVANGTQSAAATPDLGQPALLFASAPMPDPVRNLPLPQGVNFYGHLDKGSGILQQFHWFYNSSETAPTLGSITLRDSSQPSIIIPVAQTTLTNIFPDHPLDFRIKLINGIEDASEKDVEMFESGLELTASAQWSGQPISLSAIVHDENEGVLEVRSDTSLGLPSTADLQSFFGGHNITGDLPAKFQGGNLVEVSSLAFGIGLNTQQIEYARLVLTALDNEKLTVIPPDVIEVGDLKFYFTMYTGQTPSFIFSGMLEIQGVDFTVSARLPDFSIAATPDEGNVINLSQIAKHFGLPAGAPDIEITELSLSATPPPASSYYLFAELEGFPVAAQTGSFVIELLSFEFQSDPTGKTLHLRGSFTIAGTGIEVSINSDNGWKFEGTTRQDQLIPIGALLDDLAKKFNVELPDALADFSLKNLDVSFSSSSDAQEFTFTCACLFPIAGADVAIDVFIDVKKTTSEQTAVAAVGTGDTTQTSDYDVTVKGKLKIGIEEFDVEFDKTKGSKKITVSWAQTEGALHFTDVARKFGFTDFPTLPPALDLALESASFTYKFGDGSLAFGAKSRNYGNVVFATLLAGPASAQKREFFFLLDTGKPSFSLSNLPLVGAELAKIETITVGDLKVIISSLPSVDATTAGAVNALIQTLGSESEYPTLPTGGTTGKFIASASMQFGNAAPLPLSVSMGGSGGSTGGGSGGTQPALTGSAPTQAVAQATPAATPAAAPSGPSDGVTWFNVQKSFGPVSIGRIGVMYQSSQQTLWFEIDAALALGPLTLSLVGLGIGSPITSFEPKFNLQGLGVSYVKPPLEIAGSLINLAPPGASFIEFEGGVVVSTSKLTLEAFGYYGDKQGFSSMFIFGDLAYPFGGPPAFFLTGVALGFGYNSSLRLPTIDQVQSFPFVQVLPGGTSPNTALFGPNPTPTKVLEVITQTTPPWVRPEPGSLWFGAGITFTSFDIVNSQAMLFVETGDGLVISLIGDSRAQFPQQVGGDTPLYANIELDLEIRFAPAEGVFSAQAVLASSSFVLDPACVLTGGFAFFVWYGESPHAGDFVLTLGGYNPGFTPPSHYPTVPAVGFHWAMDSSITISGGVYFALTPAVMMVGGRLDATYQSGNLKAWFDAHADVIVRWKPFWFDADIGITIGASYKIDLLFTSATVSVELGCELEFWGPPTGGSVTVDWYIISFTIGFGTSKQSGQTIKDWSDVEAMLPNSSSTSTRNVLVATPTAGMTPAGASPAASSAEADAANAPWLVRGSRFAFTASTPIPATLATVGATYSFNGSKFNVYPLGWSEVSSNLTVAITDREQADRSSAFKVALLRKSVPASLWGSPPQSGDLTPQVPSANAQLLPGHITGVAVEVNPPQIGASAGAVDAESALAFVDLNLSGANLPLSGSAQPAGDVPVNSGNVVSAIADSAFGIASQKTNAARTALFAGLTTLGYAPDTANDSMAAFASSVGCAFAAEPLLVA